MSILKGAGVAKSIDDLRRSASGGSRSGRSAQLFLKSDSSVKVRFLQEPTTFMEYLEHYDKGRNMFVPAIDNDPLDQHPDEQVRKVGKRWLSNILNVEDGQVRIVKLNQDQMNRLLTRYTRYGTLLDRNYELIRIGAGRDTKYDVDSDDPTQMDLSRFTPRCHDLTEFLLSEVDEYHDTNFADEYRRERDQNGSGEVQEAPQGAQEPPLSPEARAAEAAAQKVAGLDEKYGAEPPWTDQDGTDEKTPPAPPPPAGAMPAQGMAEVAAEVEAQKLQAVPDPSPTGEVDPWVEAKKNGQPCVRGEDDKCAICGFPVTECLMAK